MTPTFHSGALMRAVMKGRKVLYTARSGKPGLGRAVLGRARNGEVSRPLEAARCERRHEGPMLFNQGIKWSGRLRHGSAGQGRLRHGAARFGELWLGAAG